MRLDYYSVALLALALAILLSVAYILMASQPQPQEPVEPEKPQETAEGPAPALGYSPPSCSQISSCILGDGCCPEGCTTLDDYDCPAASLGETVAMNGLQLQLDFIEERRCIGFSDNEDYIYYLVFEAKFKNLLNRSQYISYPSFRLLDTEGSRYSPDPVLPYYSCRDYYQDLLLETKYIQPNQSITGEIWIEINKEEDPIEGTLRMVYDPLPKEEGEEFVYKFNYSG